MSSPRFAVRLCAPLFACLVLFALGSIARAEDQVPGFVCLGESEALLRGTSIVEIRFERDKRLRWLAQGKVPPARRAHTHCVVAELMRRLGDVRAEHHYERAIALNSNDPAYELWYTRYLNGSRGAGAALAEGTQAHAFLALDKLEGFHGITQTGSTDDVARAWTQRHLLTLTQEDGLPLLPWNAFPYRRRHRLWPQLSVAALGSLTRDTNDFWDFADTRKLTTEAQLAADRTEDKTLTRAALEEVLRAPVRYEGLARVRLRQSWIGTLDGHYRRMRLWDSQIVSFADVNERTDVDIEEVGVTWRRTLDLYPAFDLTLDAGYARQNRVGVVETLPDELETLNVYVVSPTISRFVGPDKISLGGTYVYFDIPERPEPAIDQSQRQRVIRAGFIDYALYRPLRLPQVQYGTFAARRTSTRGLHFFATAMHDQERFGSSVIDREAYSFGSTLKGIEGYDVGLIGMYVSNSSELDRVNQPQLGNSQFRTTVRMMKRLVDEDVVPGLPNSPLTSLNLSAFVRHDAALSGPVDYESVRGTLELWGKFVGLRVRGTSFLVTVSGSYQYFYQLDQGLVLGQLMLRMGWPTFGTLNAY